MLSTSLTAPFHTPYLYESMKAYVARHFVREHSCDSEYSAQPQPTADQPVDRIDDLGIAQAHSVHEALTQLHSAGNQVRLRFLEILQMLRDNNLFVELGYSSFAQYCDREFGLSRSTAMEYVRVARALDGLPRLRVLFGEGSLSWQQVRSITRAATVQTETSWIELAVTEPVRKLEAEVREAVRTGRDAPREKRNGLPNLLVRLTIDLTLEEKERLLTALMLVSEAMENEDDPKACNTGADAGDGTMPAGGRRPVLVRWADGILSGAIPASPAGPVSSASEARAVSRPGLRPTPSQTIVYHACPECRAATLQTNDGPVSVSEMRIEELTPSSNVVEIGPEDELPAIGLPVDELDPPNSASLARKVVQRDGARCGNPGCENRLRLHAHHIVFRSAGGPTCLANEIAVCDLCHAMIHAGLLEVSGSPYTDITWTPRPFSPAAKLHDAREVCARAREIGALLARIAPNDSNAPIGSSPESRHANDGEDVRQVSRRVDTSTPCGELTVEPVSRHGDTPHGWHQLAGARQSRHVDTDARVRELAGALVSLGYSRSDGRRLVEGAFAALAGQAQTDAAILREALRDRGSDGT